MKINHAKMDKKVQSSSTTCRTLLSTSPLLKNILIAYLKNLKNICKLLPQRLLMNSSIDPDAMLCQRLLSVIGEVPPDKCTEVKGDIYAYNMYIVSTCRKHYPFPRFQPWGLCVNASSGSFTKSLPSPIITHAMSQGYSGPPPMYTPFHQSFQTMHEQPNPCCLDSSLSFQSESPIDFGREPSHSSIHSPYSVYEMICSYVYSS